MTIRRSSFISDTYTKISNKVAQDTSISCEAKGVWLYLISQPPSWNVQPRWLAKELGMGKDRMYRILNELIEKRLCTRTQLREKHISGRQVVGAVEYVIYGEPGELEEFQRPCFKDTEIEKTENQDLINNRVLETTEVKEKPPQPPSKKPNVRPQKEKVVVPSFLEGIPNLPRKLAEKLLFMFSVIDLQEAVKMLQSSKVNIDRPFGWIRSCINDGYEKVQNSEERAEVNKKTIRDCFAHLDGKVIGGNRITVGRTYIEFLIGGVGNKTKTIDVSEPNFESAVRQYIQDLQ